MATTSTACTKRAAPQTVDRTDDDLVNQLVKSLNRRFNDCGTDAEYAAFAREAVARFSDATVMNFVPILAQRHALVAAHAHCANRTTDDLDATP